MKYLLHILFLFFNLQFLIAQTCQYNTVIELCLENIESLDNPDDIFTKVRPKNIDREIVGDAGFIAGLAALDTYKNDAQRALLIKEAMCRCVVSQKFTCDQLKITDQVIRESKNPLSIGIAWYRKSRIYYFKNKYEEALNYSHIALQTLNKAGLESSKDDGISDREFFESLCHSIQVSSYNDIGDKVNYEIEKRILKNYEWFSYIQ